MAHTVTALPSGLNSGGSGEIAGTFYSIHGMTALVGSGFVANSDNGGLTWTAGTKNLGGPEDVYWFGAGSNSTHTFVLGEGGHIKVSNDNGATWSHGKTSTSYNAVLANDNLVLLMNFSGKHAYSNDNGDNWTELPAGNLPYLAGFAVLDTGEFVGINETNTYITTDGINWEAKPTGIALGPYSVGGGGCGDTIYIGMSNNTLLRSTDLGDSWIDITADTGLTGRARRIYCDGDVVVAGGGNNNATASIDNGVTWENIDLSPTNPEVGISGIGRRIVCAGYSNISLVSLGAKLPSPPLTYEPLLKGANSGNVGWAYDLASNGTNIVAMVNSGYCSVSSDRGDNWTRLPRYLGNTGNPICMVAIGDTFLAGHQGGAFSKSVNGGFGWTKQSQGLGLPSGESPGILCGEGDNLVCMSGSQALGSYSEDQGATWTPIPLGLGIDLPNGGAIGSGCGNGNIVVLYRSNIAVRSTDFGKTWTRLPDAFGGPGSLSLPYYDLASDGNFFVAAGYGGYVAVSKDAGATWTSLPRYPTLESGTGNYLTLDVSGTTAAIMHSQGAGIATVDSGDTWFSLERGNGSNTWYSVDAISAVGEDYVSIDKNGLVYRINFPSVIPPPSVPILTVPDSIVQGAATGVSATAELNGGTNPIYLWEYSEDGSTWLTGGFDPGNALSSNFTYYGVETSIFVRFTTTTDQGSNSAQKAVTTTVPIDPPGIPVITAPATMELGESSSISVTATGESLEYLWSGLVEITDVYSAATTIVPTTLGEFTLRMDVTNSSGSTTASQVVTVIPAVVPTLPTGGAITLNDISDVFPISPSDMTPYLEDFYAGGSRVPAGTVRNFPEDTDGRGQYAAVPENGPISLYDFYGAPATIPTKDLT